MMTMLSTTGPHELVVTSPEAKVRVVCGEIAVK